MSIVERERVEVQTEVTRRDVLHRAADLLEEFGWCQGELHTMVDGQPAYCVIGATARAAFDLGVIQKWDEGFLSIQTALPIPREWWLDWFDGDWNDVPGRTKAQVVAKLRGAAEQS